MHGRCGVLLGLIVSLHLCLCETFVGVGGVLLCNFPSESTLFMGRLLSVGFIVKINVFHNSGSIDVSLLTVRFRILSVRNGIGWNSFSFVCWYLGGRFRFTFVIPLFLFCRSFTERDFL